MILPIFYLKKEKIMANFEKLVIDSIDMVTMFSKSTGELLLLLDQPKDGSLENANETVYMSGKRGMRLSALDRNKTSKFSCNNAYVVAGALAAQLGAEITDASATDKIRVPDIEVITLTTATTATLRNIPVGTSGAEIPFIYKVNSDASQGEKLVAAATAVTGKFKIEAASKTITFADGEFSVGDKIIVPYDYETASGRKIVNSGENFGKYGRLVIDVLMRDVCDENIKYHGKIEYPSCKVDGNFTLSIGDEPAVQAFSAEAMINACNDDKILWNMYLCE